MRAMFVSKETIESVTHHVSGGKTVIEHLHITYLRTEVPAVLWIDKTVDSFSSC